ncbi:hypothetical protein [Anaeromyxobacter sp. Fw109-5]|uniref:hypothetical protein n=1 Tax=Anaeromyxobacter sp. (strain Fw109-5) TaxID=404589 RepID=UPI000158A55A|nr:hypothetical protein [Anaeromyxobacter sp. Fw109-5]ABS24757.1 conserved hypothetical protein [Anaeromyxobacter sp. Fw109-5]
MRKLLSLTIALAVLAGCGDDDDGGGGPALTGKLHGETFDPAEVVFAGPRQSASCEFPGFPITYGIGDALIAFSPEAGGGCALADPCAGRRSFTFVAGLLAHAEVPAPAAAPALDGGSYAVYGSLDEAVPALATSGGGSIRTALLAAQQTDAQCAPVAAPPSASGTIRLDAVSATELRGQIDVSFADGQGGFLRGQFTARPCPAVTFDACFSDAGLTCSGTPSCQ